jgi:hypothetical protein
MPTGAQFGIGFTDPANPEYDHGHCDQDRTHLANVTVGAQTPQVASPVLRVASNGQSNQRVDQMSDDVYGAKTHAVCC